MKPNSRFLFGFLVNLPSERTGRPRSRQVTTARTFARRHRKSFIQTIPKNPKKNQRKSASSAVKKGFKNLRESAEISG
jgi:hypothetical protein